MVGRTWAGYIASWLRGLAGRQAAWVWIFLGQKDVSPILISDSLSIQWGNQKPHRAVLRLPSLKVLQQPLLYTLSAKCYCRLLNSVTAIHIFGGTEDQPLYLRSRLSNSEIRGGEEGGCGE